MCSFLSDTLFKSFSSKYFYFKIHDSNIAYYSKCTGREKHQKKETNLTVLSFQICVVTNVLPHNCLCLCSFCFWGDVSNSWILNYIGRNSLLGNRKKIVKFLMRTFTCSSTFLYECTSCCSMQLETCCIVYTVKKVSGFPVPARMSLTKLSLALIIPGRVW